MSSHFPIWKAGCLDAMSGAAAAILHRDTTISEGPDDLKATGFKLRCLNRGNHSLYHISRQYNMSIKNSKARVGLRREGKIWCPCRQDSSPRLCRPQHLHEVGPARKGCPQKAGRASTVRLCHPVLPLQTTVSQNCPSASAPLTCRGPARSEPGVSQINFLDLVMHTSNPSNRKAEAGGSLSGRATMATQGDPASTQKNNKHINFTGLGLQLNGRLWI